MVARGAEVLGWGGGLLAITGRDGLPVLTKPDSTGVAAPQAIDLFDGDYSYTLREDGFYISGLGPVSGLGAAKFILARFDPASGKTLWSSEFNKGANGAGVGTYIVDGAAILTETSRGTVGLDLATGLEIWAIADDNRYYRGAGPDLAVGVSGLEGYVDPASGRMTVPRFPGEANLDLIVNGRTYLDTVSFPGKTSLINEEGSTLWTIDGDVGAPAASGFGRLGLIGRESMDIVVLNTKDGIVLAEVPNGIADPQREECLLSLFGGLGALPGIVEDRIERGVEDELDELARRVVAAGGLAVVPGKRLEREGVRDGVVPSREFEQRLVDRAQLLCAEMGEVDEAARLSLRLDDRQGAHRGEQCGVRQLAHREDVGGGLGEQPTEAGRPPGYSSAPWSPGSSVAGPNSFSLSAASSCSCSVR